VLLQKSLSSVWKNERQQIKKREKREKREIKRREERERKIRAEKRENVSLRLNNQLTPGSFLERVIEGLVFFSLRQFPALPSSHRPRSE